ncbi:STAS domain-containing protein [Bacillus sp. 31A1R]|uniref:STAS domain-containing protein n=1 Tax=Robertmurraya mangrovi TaxID=3098077 RepID=A0ABU5J587_9BACI|nr:STAS domain-containing protein [Bacillus sp. 31A1R]MDZ5474591.1 STAS domain-containing protein [Bacillus sp. 31A1R]
MLINFLIKGEILHASFHSDLHFETSHQLETELTDFNLKDHVRKVTIDFSKVRFVDSSGISLLLKWIHPMTRKVEVELIHVSEPVQNILKICKLDQFATIRP